MVIFDMQNQIAFWRNNTWMIIRLKKINIPCKVIHFY